jgi:hypothetical protein
MSTCKHCKNEFEKKDIANHSRWCDLNPKRSEYKNGSMKSVLAMNEARAKSGIKNQYSYGAVCSEETKEKLRQSATGRTHTEETKQLLREKALASPHRRLRKGMVEYKGVMLDSSWELELAKRLDELEIKWIRPKPIQWVDKEGVTHNYFGDFYLTEHDLYLDPKNPQAIRVQKEKLDCLLSQHKNIVIIDSIEKCKEFNMD